MLGEQLVLPNCIPFNPQDREMPSELIAPSLKLAEFPVAEESISLTSQKETNDAVEDHDLAREEASETFYKIETQFKKVAARIFAKKVKDIEQEQKAITKGTHTELNNMWQIMEANHNQRLKDLEAFSRFQMEKIDRYKAIAIDQIISDFEVAKKKRKREMIKELYAKRIKERCARPKSSVYESCASSRPLDIKLQRHRERDEWLRRDDVMVFSCVNSLDESDIQNDLISLGLRKPSLNPISSMPLPVSLPSPLRVSPTNDLLSVCNFDSAYGSHSDASNSAEKLYAQTSPIPFPSKAPLQPPGILFPQYPPVTKSVQIRDGKIFVDDYCFSKGDCAFVFDGGLSYSVKLIQISEDKLIIVRADGLKTTLNVDLLIDGKVLLTPQII